MEALDKKYKLTLDNIKGAVQASQELATYLDTEEDDDYRALYEAYEPQIDELYSQVAAVDPLQLVELEDALLDEGFEGLYLPRILGYSVLRGAVDDVRVKYVRPQDHFRTVLLAISNNANFDVLKRRIGQSIQIGFALSSDIYITNFLNDITNKRVKYFLESQKLEKYRTDKFRRMGLKKYRKQFESLNYQSASFPTSLAELKTRTQETVEFLTYRATGDFDNTSLYPQINNILGNESFREELEFLDLLITIGMYYELEKDGQNLYIEALDFMRSNATRFEEEYFTRLEALHNSKQVTVTPDMDKRMSLHVNKGIDDMLSKYYNLTDKIHSLGYVHEDVIEAVRSFVDGNEGLSPQNECIRSTVFEYFAVVLNNLTPAEYQDYFEINKVFTVYIQLFANERFTQEVKVLSLRYVKRLIKTYTDKRGRDYQDIKKFVVSTFEDLGFMDLKELKELFKTKRKKKVEA